MTSTQEPSFAILGPGGIGGFLAALLHQQGFRVRCIARATNGGAGIQKIKLESFVYGQLLSEVPVSSRLESAPDVLFVTVKSYQLTEAIDKIDPALVSNAVVIPLLNGLGHYELLRTKFGGNVVAATIGLIEAASKAPGHIVHSSGQPPQLEMASDHGVSTERLAVLTHSLIQAGINASVLDSEAQVIWRKLARLNAIAATTAAAQEPLGVVRSDPDWRALLEGALREAVSISRQEGVVLDADVLIKQIEAMPSELSTSLQRDVAQGRRGEIDAIPGAVIAAGRKYGIATPSVEVLYEKILCRVK